MDRLYFVAGLLLISVLSACAERAPPQQPQAKKVADAELRPPWQLIGMKLDDADVQDYIARSASEPDREIAPGYGVFVSLYRDGVELSADTAGTITTVIIYRSGVNKYEEYSGPMPQSLNWEMTRDEVEQALGIPDRFSFTPNSTTGRYEYYAQYPELDLYLNYDAQTDTDQKARLNDMRIKNSQLSVRLDM
jgi:hypothetical protein